MLRDGPKGRGVFTVRSYAQGEELYQVPDRVWFTELTIAHKTARFAQVLAEHATEPPPTHLKHGDSPTTFQAQLANGGLSTVKLAFALEAERFHSDSFYAPYINTLPTVYSSQPMFWADSTLEE